jgi:hypothetical protein
VRLEPVTQSSVHACLPPLAGCPEGFDDIRVVTDGQSQLGIFRCGTTATHQFVADILIRLSEKLIRQFRRIVRVNPLGVLSLLPAQRRF